MRDRRHTPRGLTFVLFVALHAVVVPLLDVGPQVGRLGEPVTAHRALEGLLSGVDHHVVEERLPGGELLLTDRADQQLLPGVDPLVLLHAPLPLERLITPGVWTPESVRSVQLLGLEVDHQMTSELPGPVPDPGALGTGEPLLARVLLGNFQGGQLRPSLYSNCQGTL